MASLSARWEDCISFGAGKRDVRVPFAASCAALFESIMEQIVVDIGAFSYCSCRCLFGRDSLAIVG